MKNRENFEYVPMTNHTEIQKRLDVLNSFRISEFLLHDEVFDMLRIAVWDLDERKEHILNSDVIDVNDCILTEIKFLCAGATSADIKIRLERLVDLSTFLSAKTKTENNYYVVRSINSIISSIKDVQNRLIKMLLKKSDVKFIDKRV